MSTAIGQSQSELKALQEAENQLREWERQGRTEDIKIVGSHKTALMKQVKAGRIDLQAIVDDHNYNHPDGKYYGQEMPEKNAGAKPAIDSDTDSATESTRESTSNAAARTQPATDDVPESNRPVAAYTYLENQWTGFPATLSQVAKQAYVFPNGNAVYCANWDPRKFDPTPESIGRALPKCVVRREVPDGKKTNGFRKGQRVDISFGNVSGDSRNLGTVSSSTIAGSVLRMTRDGKIAIGRFNAFSVGSGGDGAGGGNRKRVLRGDYALDGHLIEIVTTDGEALVGFIAWSSDKGNDSIDHIFVNGEHFWRRGD